MKVLVRDYVASLKEREELDAILPDLLSELGFNVISRPGRGTTQRGVDIAAIERGKNGKQRFFLFTVKPGDLTRQEWDGNSQKVRPSLNEILDDYIPTRIPEAYRKLKIVIVICIGGDVHESARSLLTQFTKRHTTRRVSFEEWNGDKIAELLLSGILREELLPKQQRSSFQKAVAMVDQPDIAFEHFSRLILSLRNDIKKSKDAVRVSRQIYICLWVLFVWARDIDNLDAPFRASEAALLNLWEIMKPFIGKRTADAKAIAAVIQHTVNLHIQIGTSFLDRKVIPHVNHRHRLSTAVATRTSVDVNLRLFDTLGRLAMVGHWMAWASSIGGTTNREFDKLRERLVKSGVQMISNNPALFLPLLDEHAIEITLFLMLAVQSGAFGDMHAWLMEMNSRLDFATRTNGQYPCRFSEYQDLIAHPREDTDEYRKDALPGSILIPTLAAWLAAFREFEALGRLIRLKVDKLESCTVQLWLPEMESEDHLYLNDDSHGAALADLPIEGDGTQLLQTIKEACDTSEGFTALSATRTGYWPIILMACRHYRLPIPPQFWIAHLIPPATKDASGVSSS
ncbi:hypothetical protein E4K66_36495 [Bradyrhizobium frederickii]|uniref:Chemotaxis protein n=1 Tax=Bradyrhizobium frederickii TaxID=2560054 RepID=A0A4Y9KPW7_9BRAD|nr:hypothetical protein [Bradyrhizobium frederickii]TFV30176.1 hypothetical protein E4K66_36495 [Bradyrhizobium frederickii]